MYFSKTVVSTKKVHKLSLRKKKKVHWLNETVDLVWIWKVDVMYYHIRKCFLRWEFFIKEHVFPEYYQFGECSGTPLQYSCLKNPMDGGAWWAAVHEVARHRTRLSDFTFTFHFHALEKEMATHSSVLAWRIPGMGKPGGPSSMGLHRVGHDWSDLAELAAASLGHHLFL